MTDTELRPYQCLAVDHVMGALRAGAPRTWIEMPTGTGKTRVLSALVDKATRGRVLALAHTDLLVRQLAEGIGADGIEMAHSRANGAAIVAGSVQTLTRKARLDALVASGPPISIVLVDECHHVSAKSYRRILDGLGDARVVGATATPERADGADIETVLGPPAFARSILDMQRAGWLSPLAWSQLDVSAELDQLPTKGGDYSAVELGQEMSRVSAASAAAVVPLFGDGHPGVIYAVTLAHARCLRDELGARGICVGMVSGEQTTTERDLVLQAWRCGTLQVVVNVGVLLEGFDFPAISTVIIARPTRSRSRYLQMVGRGTRPSPGKERCVVVDLGGNEDHSDPHQITLPDVAGVMTEADLAAITARPQVPGDPRDPVLALVGSRARARTTWRVHRDLLWSALAPGKWGVVTSHRASGLASVDIVLREGEAGTWRWTRYPVATDISPHRVGSVIAAQLSALEVKALVRPNAAWRSRPISPSQAKTLANQGIYPPETRGEASDILDARIAGAWLDRFATLRRIDSLPSGGSND
ncbi:MAG: DEAD/DEAH box helicase [Acidimicrobiales bacterium]